MRSPYLVYYPSGAPRQAISLGLVVEALRALELKQKLFLELEGTIADKKEQREAAIKMKKAQRLINLLNT